MIGERVFLRDVVFEDGFELRPFRREFREFKPAPFLEADEEDAFAVLRHDAPRINDLIINRVAKILGQGVVDDLKRAALVVAAEVLHVLQHERRGSVIINDVGQREEEVALFLVLEAVLVAEAQFLGDARDAKGLAGKAGAQDVVRGNVRHGHGMNVAVGAFAVIGFVGDLGLLVPVGQASDLSGEVAADVAHESGQLVGVLGGDDEVVVIRQEDEGVNRHVEELLGSPEDSVDDPAQLGRGPEQESTLESPLSDLHGETWRDMAEAARHAGDKNGLRGLDLRVYSLHEGGTAEGRTAQGGARRPGI